MKSPAYNSFYVKIIKSLLDYGIALIVLVPALPFFFIVSIVLAFVNEGKVFFVQKRTGLGERVFSAFKFRTMNEKRDEFGELLPDERRLTKAGAIIRKTSLDEIPQLLNVLKGDMSFVGPRPLLPEYLPYYNSQQRMRHLVKPGITGLAQVNGRNLTTWEKRLDFDIEYVNNVSFWLDMKILLKTVVNVLRSEGVVAEGSVTMPKFSDYIKEKSK